MFNIQFQNELREAELSIVSHKLPADGHVLEFGSGTGAQARQLSLAGFEVTAIDLPNSDYAESRIFPVVDYDGRNIPLEASSVDAIFSSNVLEHVEEFDVIALEFHRILRPGGVGVYILPSAAWRAWTLAVGPIAAIELVLKSLAEIVQARFKAAAVHLRRALGAILPIGHGTANEAFSELWTFSSLAWQKKFAAAGFFVAKTYPIGIFYTGHMILGHRLSIARRQAIAKILGSGATVYIVEQASLAKRS